jgi:Short C-terminal domain
MRSPAARRWGSTRWVASARLEQLRDRGLLNDEEFQPANDRRQRAQRGAASRADDLARVEDLRDHGVLTDEEFQRAKDKAAA